VIKAIPRSQGAGSQVFDAEWAYREGLISPQLVVAAMPRTKDREDLKGRFVRIDPDLPFDTITTTCRPRNNRGQGKTVSDKNELRSL